jgi:hypothetical protein
MATPPVFTAGAVLTAAQMNAIGLWLVKTQTIGTTVSSVAVTDAFSADFDSYQIMIAGGVGSTTNDLGMVLGSTVTGYYAAVTGSAYSSFGATGATDNNAAKWTRVGAHSTAGLFMNITLHDPFLATRTWYQGVNVFPATNQGAYAAGGYLNDATSYTDFTISPGSGTLTGGEIRVYGYRE